MISQTLDVAWWEWFKLRKRWLPWVLLAVLLLFTQMITWPNFFDYRSLNASGGRVAYGAAASGGTGPQEAATVDCVDLRSGNLPSALRSSDPAVVQGLLTQCDQQTETHKQDLRDEYANFTPPGIIAFGLQHFQLFILLMLVVLVASVVGTEYGLGTLRPNLAEGIGRLQFLAGKLLLMMAIAAATLMVLVAALCITGLVAPALQPAPAGFTAASWGHAFTVVARIWSSLIPFAVIAAFVTVLTASTASGMAIALGYYFAELIVVGIFSSFSWFGDVSNYLVGHAISEWSGSLTFNRFIGSQTTSASDLTLALVLIAYTLIFGVLAFAVFLRRDITGASGG